MNSNNVNTMDQLGIYIIPMSYNEPTFMPNSTSTCLLLFFSVGGKGRARPGSAGIINVSSAALVALSFSRFLASATAL